MQRVAPVSLPRSLRHGSMFNWLAARRIYSVTIIREQRGQEYSEHEENAVSWRAPQRYSRERERERRASALAVAVAQYSRKRSGNIFESRFATPGPLQLLRGTRERVFLPEDIVKRYASVVKYARGEIPAIERGGVLSASAAPRSRFDRDTWISEGRS
jgi:hypothetical protein